MRKVVDVSRHQGKINFTKLRGGVDGIIIRVNYRTYGNSSNVYMDDRFEENCRGAISNNIPIVGFYGYTECLSIQELNQEIDMLLAAIQPYKAMITDGIFFDYEGYTEPDHRAFKSTKDTRTSYFNHFYERIKKEGLTPYLYGSSGLITKGYDLSKIPSDSELWVARYYGGYDSVISDLKYKPVLKGYNERIVAWQYTSIGRVEGIVGNVDINLFYKGTTKAENPFSVPKGLIRYNPVTKFVALDSVRWLQWCLQKMGLYKGAIDGKYGQLTLSAVTQFQVAFPETYTTRKPDLIIGELSKRILIERSK
jgi:GH25 family lysozyme M1 (1,4-beta-N-acetylmuramidase)